MVLDKLENADNVAKLWLSERSYKYTLFRPTQHLLTSLF
jgi:hypothetical protein